MKFKTVGKRLSLFLFTIPLYIIGFLTREGVGLLAESYDTRRELSIRNKAVNDLKAESPSFQKALVAFDTTKDAFPDLHAHRQYLITLHRVMDDPCSVTFDGELAASKRTLKHQSSKYLLEAMAPRDDLGNEVSGPLDKINFQYLSLIAASRTTLFSKSVDELCQPSRLAREYAAKYSDYKNDRPFILSLANASNTSLFCGAVLASSLYFFKQSRKDEGEEVESLALLGPRRAALRLGWRPRANH